MNDSQRSLEAIENAMLAGLDIDQIVQSSKETNTSKLKQEISDSLHSGENAALGI